MDMSLVSKCNVSDCAYNAENNCCTPGINVGAHAQCNTFIHGSRKGGSRQAKSGIGACLASECQWNTELECQASNVDVTVHNGHADCHTFREKK